jgi:hypothetical protein
VCVEADTFEDYLGLAKIIASECTNIPGLTKDEEVSEAHEALIRTTSKTFGPRKGEFTPYTARSIRHPR